MMSVLYSLVLGIYGNYTAPYTHNSFLLILWILTSQFCIHLFHTKSVFVSSTVKYNLVFTDCPILNGIEERVKKKKKTRIGRYTVFSKASSNSTKVKKSQRRWKRRESKQFITVKGMPKVQVLNSLGLIWLEIKNT